MNKSLKTSLIVLVAGIVAVAVGTFFTVSGRRQAARDTEPAAATVLRYDEETEYNSGTEMYETVYYLVVSYEVNGKTVESRYTQGGSDQKYKAGDALNIKYNPADPEEYVIDGDGSINGPIWVIPVGAILIVAGLARILVPAVMAKKSKKENTEGE